MNDFRSGRNYDQSDEEPNDPQSRISEDFKVKRYKKIRVARKPDLENI